MSHSLIWVDRCHEPPFEMSLALSSVSALGARGAGFAASHPCPAKRSVPNVIAIQAKEPPCALARLPRA